MIREIVTIDEELCDGCGLCVPACHEGALKIVNGKARLVADVYCDGLGACLGHCPRGAIKIERREAEEFDEAAVERHLAQDKTVAKPETLGCPSQHLPSTVASRGNGSGNPVSQATKHELKPVEPSAHQPHHHAGGCPGSRFTRFERPIDRLKACPTVDDRLRIDHTQPEQAAGPRETAPAQISELTHWPVQLRLLSPEAPVLTEAKLLVAADCVPVAYPDFHRDFLRDRAVVIACPKLDDPRGYVEKLEAMIRRNNLREITVVHMEVPCCQGILNMVFEALQRAEACVPVVDVVIGIRGEVLSRRRMEINTEQVKS